MTLNEALWDRALKLANRPYCIVWDVCTLPTGESIHMLRHHELPGCKAQGGTIDEARANLDDARTDYIYALLETGLPVPPPCNWGEPSNPNMDSTALVKLYIFEASKNW